MKVPKDPNLYLTVFTGIGVTIVMAFWLLTPVYTPHLEHDEPGASVRPAQALGQVDAMLTAAEQTLAEMDAKEGGDKAESTNEHTQTLPAKEGSKPVKIVPTSVPDADAAHDMAGHEMPEHDMAGHEMPEHDMAGHEMPEHDMAGHAPDPEESSHSHEAGGDHGH